MLIEIAPGLWARPEAVMAVRTTCGTTHGTLTLKPAVYLHVANCSEIGWEFETWEDAKAWAAKIAAVVSAKTTT